MKNVIVIKIKNDHAIESMQTVVKYLNQSYETGKEQYYVVSDNSSNEDREFIKKIETDIDEKNIVFVEYWNEGKIALEDSGIIQCEISNIYIGSCNGVESSKIKYTIRCKIENKDNESRKQIANLLDNIELDIKKDYEYKSYLMVSKVDSFLQSVEDFLAQEPTVRKGTEKYQSGWNTYELKEYAQKNEACIRMYNNNPIEDENRGEYHRDRERIVNCKAFRRMVDKAQIFSATKGDHYRTRMTHTLEVNQIAKAISITLGLNVDLTEAIALGHDLGHTPFGHQGERTLDDILKGEKCEELLGIEKGLLKENILGGFKHNYQSVRVLTRLENKYIEFPGLNISFQVLEGVLKHTELKKEKYNLAEFIDKDFADYLKETDNYSITLEGQVVAIADEIAQRGHDIDDALSSELISCDELINMLSVNKGSALAQGEGLKRKIEKEVEKLNIGHRFYEDRKELLTQRIVSVIVNYFMNNVINESKENLKDYKGQVDKKYIDMSEEVEAVCKYLEKVINKRVISNSEVVKFDQNADKIVQKLFSTYYSNPRLLHKGTLRKIYRDMLEDDIIRDVAIPLFDGNLDIIREEIDKIVNNVEQISRVNINENGIEQLLHKKKIIIRNIVDYIAGMTDSYATMEYEHIR